jgi:hypothetical protein
VSTRRVRRILAGLLVASLAVTSIVSCTKASSTVTSTAPAADADRDGLPDDVELKVGTDPNDFDTDHDGLTDYYELVGMPERADTSPDQDSGLLPGVEVAYAAEASGPKPVEPPAGTPKTDGWKTIDVKHLPDANRDGVHDALDEHGAPVPVKLTDVLAGRVHNAICDTNGWWDPDKNPSDQTVPTAAKYVEAFKGLLRDATNTPAPVMNDPTDRIDPDTSLLTDPLDPAKAKKSFVGVGYDAAIPNWKLDDPDHGGDLDGIPTGYETYGYSCSGSDFVPWGFTCVGKSSYTPPTVGFEVVGSVLVPKAANDLDYGVQYFKTDHLQASSDADPYDDKLETIRANLPPQVNAPADRPVVAAYPSIVGELVSANVHVKQDVTTTQGQKTTKGTFSGSVEPASPLPGVSVTGLVMGKSRPKTGLVGKGLDFADNQAVNAAYGKLAGEPKVGSKFPAAAISAKFGMTTDEWSQATMIDTEHAAGIDLKLNVSNTGFADADSVMPVFDLVLGDQVVPGVKPANPVPQLPAGKSQVVDIADINLTLDQLRSYMSGAPVSVVLRDGGAQMSVPVRDPGTGVISYVPKGSWAPFSGAIDKSCARLTIDLGDGTFATYPVLAKYTDGVERATLLDGLLWSLGVYQGGRYAKLNVPPFPGTDASAAKVPSFANWMFCFDGAYDPAVVEGSAGILSVPLVPGSHIYARAPIADGDRPAIAWASVSCADSGTLDVTNAESQVAKAAVNADMAVGSVWLAPSAKADRSQWTAMTWDDIAQVYTAPLPRTLRAIALQTPVVVAESATRWGDGKTATATVSTVATATAYTGVTGDLTANITQFPSDADGLPKQIACFDLDSPSAQVVGHDQWSSPPGGTDLSMWVYSTYKHSSYTDNYDVTYHTFAEVYQPWGGISPRWMGKDASWLATSPDKSLSAMNSSSSKKSWKSLSGGIWELGMSDLYEKGDTILLVTNGGRWAKVTITDISYDTHFLKGGSNEYTLQSVKLHYTSYDPGQSP